MYMTEISPVGTGSLPDYLVSVLNHRGLAELTRAAEAADLPTHRWNMRSKEFEIVIPIPKGARTFSSEAPREITVKAGRITNGAFESVPVVLVSATVEPLASGHFSAYALSMALDRTPHLSIVALRIFNELHGRSTTVPPGIPESFNPVI